MRNCCSTDYASRLEHGMVCELVNHIEPEMITLWQ